MARSTGDQDWTLVDYLFSRKRKQLGERPGTILVVISGSMSSEPAGILKRPRSVTERSIHLAPPRRLLASRVLCVPIAVPTLHAVKL